MEEDGFKVKARPPRKERRPGPPPLLAAVRRLILTGRDEYVLRDEVFRGTRASSEQAAGVCLGLLLKEGVLELRDVPKSEKLKYRGYHVVWDGRAWILCQDHIFLATRTSRARGQHRRLTVMRSKEDLAEIRRKNPPVDSGWDGMAYYVVRGEAFRKACVREGLPEDPFLDWTCECKNVNPIGRDCCSCGLERGQTWADAMSKSFSKDEPKNVCKRCGAVMDMKSKRGSRKHPDHGLRKCDAKVISGVMED